MATQSLVVSRDPEILGILGPLMRELGIGIEICPEFPGAMDSLRHNQYDTVIVDCDQDKGGFELLMKLRRQQGNQKMVAVGITSDLANTQAAFNSGATFVLNKPVPVEDARRILRITKGVITRAVRRFMRLPVETLSVVSIDDHQEAIINNISQRGLAIQAAQMIPTGKMIYVTFLLPDTFTLIEGMAQVMWSDISGRAGIEFRALEDESQVDLNAWVFERVKKCSPDAAAAGGSYQGQEEAGVVYETVPVQSSDMPFRSTAAALLGLAIDLGVIACGIVVFFSFGVLAGNPVNNPAAAVLALVTGILFWAFYRFLFTFFGVDTPGKRARERFGVPF